MYIHCRYDEEYADTFGKFRLERIQAVSEHFLTCGDYRQGIARIRCSNLECGHDYFRPFSCKGLKPCECFFVTTEDSLRKFRK